MKHFYRLLTLAALLLLPLLPVRADGDTIASGQLTTTLDWALTSDGVLHLVGTGRMPDTFNYPDFGPWYTYRSQITAIDFPQGLTSIGQYAFYFCDNLSTVVIPEGVTAINYCAFSGCEILSSISFPSTLDTIGSAIVADAHVLTELVIPASVTSIGTRLTDGCQMLTSLVVEEGNTVYSSYSGSNVVVRVADNYLLAGCMTSVIPSTVVRIGLQAFSSQRRMTSITIPASVTTIDDSAFEYCSALESLTCEAETPPTLGGNYVFQRIDTSIPVYVPANSVSSYQTASGWSNFTNIQALPVFGTCGDNLTWSFTSSDSTLTITGTGAMYNYGKETVSGDDGGLVAPWSEQGITQSIYHLSLPEGLTSIGSSAFYYLSNLSSVDIPSTVTTIGDHAFDQCFEMTECTVAESGITSIGEYAFNYCQQLTTFEIPSTVTTIGQGAFQSCTNLLYASIPAGVTTIQPNTFYGCQMLSAVYFYDGLQTIGNSAFDACKRLTKINLPSTVTSIGDYAFEYCEALSMVDLSENLTSIGKMAFYGCPFSTIELPATLTSIGYGAFMSCSNIAAVTSLATTPPTIQSEATGATADAFPEAPDSLVITVPYTSIAAYQEAQGWSRYTYQAQSCEEEFESTEAAQMCYGDVFVWHNMELTEAGEYQDTLQTAAGCDSIVTLNLTYAPSYDFVDSMYVCESDLPIIWHNREFMTAGDYSDSLETAFGCDSIYNLHLEILTIPHSYDTAQFCYGESYTWNGQTYTAQGDYEATLRTQSGCDSIAHLHLTENPVYFYSDTITFCENMPYEWHGRTIKATGNYYDSLQTVYGCDSIYELVLTVDTKKLINDSITICEGKPAEWRGKTYYEAGVYRDTVRHSVSGCDSIVYSLFLTYAPSYDFVDSMYVCESDLPIIWHDREFMTGGDYSDSLKTAFGCDSICNLHLEILTIPHSYDTAQFCYGESYTWNGQTYTAQGDYEATLRTQSGCYSVAHLHLTENPVYFYSDTITFCENRPYEWHGRTIKATGNYYDSLQTVYGCDSIYELIATVNQTYATDLSADICQGETFTWNGNEYSETGDYPVTLSTVKSCDSVVTLHLTVNPTYYFEETGSTCEGTLYVWHNREYATAGIYYDSLTTVSGCDSIYRLTLTVRPTYAAYDTAAICYGETYTWNGQPYSAQGDYEVTFEAQNGCDSIAHLHLTENPVYFYSDTITLCENMPYEWHGRTIKATGNYYDSLQTVYGCDSIYELIATVNQTYASDESAEICEGDAYTWYEQVYTETGTYQTTLTALNGCDSVVTLHLTVNPTYFYEESASTCQGSAYTWHGRDLTEAGIYYDTLQTIHGCDSVIRLMLTVHATYTVTEEAAICDGDIYTWHGRTYTKKGIYTDTLPTLAGCDSICTLVLTVNPKYLIEDIVSIREDKLPYIWQGEPYTEAGNYRKEFISIYGCDSVHTLQLIVTELPIYTVTVIADHGVVNGTGTYPLGTNIHLEAIPDEGFEFQMWSDGSETNPKDFVVTQDTTLRALFFMPEVEQEVIVDSIETNSVTIVWDTVAGATLYELRIFKNGELVVIYEVDPDNNIVGEHHTGPDRLIARKDSTGGSSETLQVSVGGLEPGQDYTYSLDAMDDDRSYVGAQSGSFTTEEETDGLDSVLFDDRRPQPRKILQDGHLYIELPDGTRYSPEGALLDSAQ